MAHDSETDQSTETDPRYHAAYQRGYDGPEPERLTRAEERFRRPRRGEEPEGRRRAEAVAEPPSVPERWRSVVVPPEPLTPGELPVIDRADDAEETLAARPGSAWSAADTRVPIALAVTGVLFLVIGAWLFWTASTASYYDQGTAAEQFGRNLMNFLPGPALTTGLLSVGAAIAVKAARS